MAKRPSITAYYDPNPVYHNLTQVEFDQLCEKTKIPEKENTLFLIGLFVPSALNIAVSWPSEVGKIAAAFDLNDLIAVVSLIVGSMQARQWSAKKGQFNQFVQGLKNKPKVNFEIISIEEDIVRNTPKLKKG